MVSKNAEEKLNSALIGRDFFITTPAHCIALDVDTFRNRMYEKQQKDQSDWMPYGEQKKYLNDRGVKSTALDEISSGISNFKYLSPVKIQQVNVYVPLFGIRINESSNDEIDPYSSFAEIYITVSQGDKSFVGEISTHNLGDFLKNGFGDKRPKSVTRKQNVDKKNTNLIEDQENDNSIDKIYIYTDGSCIKFPGKIFKAG